VTLNISASQGHGRAAAFHCGDPRHRQPVVWVEAATNFVESVALGTKVIPASTICQFVDEGGIHNSLNICGRGCPRDAETEGAGLDAEVRGGGEDDGVWEYPRGGWTTAKGASPTDPVYSLMVTVLLLIS